MLCCHDDLSRIHHAQIHGLALALRAAGGQVVEQSWSESSHVGHLRSHPEAYRGVVAFFLQQVGRCASETWMEK